MTFDSSVLQLPAPWSRRSGVAGALMALACLPLSGCIIIKRGGMTHESRGTVLLAEAADARVLVIRNHVGEIEVIADPAAREISATAVMIGKGRSQNSADEALSEISVSLDPSRSDPRVVEAVADHPSGNSRKSYEVVWRITAPPMLELDLQNRVGDVVISGFDGPASISTDVGDITARDIARGLTVRGGVSNVEAIASGPISIRTDVGTARVTILNGPAQPVSITTDVGSISLFVPEQWTGSISAQTDTGKVAVQLPGIPSDRTPSGSGSGERYRFSLGAPDGGPPATLAADVGDIRVGTHRHLPPDAGAGINRQ